MVGTYRYDKNDRLLTLTAGEATITYGYDANGNTVELTNPQGTVSYQYDAADRMVGFDDGLTQAGYVYDADGMQVERTANGQTERYLLDTHRPNAQVLEERDGAGQVLANYTYGRERISRHGQDGATSYYHTDALGSTHLLTDPAGTATDRYAYTAFGEAAFQSGASVNPYRFEGERLDPASGLYYLRARHLDPRIGRFTQADRFEGFLGRPMTLNGYLYAGNEPTLNVDPSGYTFTLVGRMVGLNIRALKLTRAYHKLMKTRKRIESFAFRHCKGFNALYRLTELYDLLEIIDLFIPMDFIPGLFCFAEGTPVQTASGDRAIEDVQIGDWVASRDEMTGETAYKPVVEVFQRDNRPLYHLTLTDGEGNHDVLRVTPEHPFMVDGIGWANTEDLEIGDTILSLAGKLLTVERLVRAEGRHRTYNFEVADYHNYFIGGPGAWVHNMRRCDEYGEGAFSKVATATAKQLQKKFKHARDFGVEGNYNPANAKKFYQAIQQHLNKRGTIELNGTYRGQSVTFHTDPNTGLTVIQNPDGSFLSGWKLNPTQLNHVLTDGKL